MWRRMLGTTLGLGVASLDSIEAGLGDLRRTAAFVRGRVLLRPRPDDVFVATYPRSGTTWMQFLLHLLVRGPQAEFRHINEVCPWFERSLAVGSVRPEQLEAMPSPRIFKTHLPRRWLPSGGRFVYIERDPADVLPSYYALYRSYLGYDGSLDEFIERFVDGRVQYGSWWSHVEGWRRHAGDPDVLRLRYEDLRADPAATLRRVAEHCGLSTDPERIDAAVQGASLPRMKQLESKFDHATSLLLERGVVPRSFIRRGSVGEGAEGLTEPQRARLGAAATRRRHEPGLAAFLH